MKPQSRYTQLIKTEALRLGFLSCGISKSAFLEDEAPRLERWLKQNSHGEMSYMEQHFDKRLDPRKLVPDSKSVISLLYNYFPEEKQQSNTFKISKYAFGEDYHKVVKDKLFEFLQFIETNIGAVSGRVFVDSAPVLEKAWAARSGLGWVGKNSNLITKAVGSYYFIAELILDLELDADRPVTDHCGSCTACIDACPTQAIVQPYVVDGSKCISYYTIELKNQIPEYARDQWEDWIFGCDICQDVCPWNRFSKPHNEPRFVPDNKMLEMEKSDWIELTESLFSELFSKSAVKRTKFSGIQRNIKFLDT
ncbi:MAG: tRNA epoxyqueuosine(34) reductase QueG [Bacteroidota bacterium]